MHRMGRIEKRSYRKPFNQLHSITQKHRKEMAAGKRERKQEQGKEITQKGREKAVTDTSEGALDESSACLKYDCGFNGSL